ncbi:MAG: acyltransferase family protein [Legionella sp.]|uniref:acyltransferase family protein n=1 Tax=Legionella sp. TaxID=459 RepID=UPI00284CDC76|nr:acyltransferase family protein [Legionella sp.]
MELQYRKDIDGIRAVAVLAVMFFHAFPKLIPGGFIGVDVFFVISGFVISNLIIHQMANNQFHWTSFYIKRINRIFPALIIILLSALVSGYFLLFSDEYQNLSKHILGSTFFLNNFILWNEAGYFDTSSDFKPLLHLWSLGIEEQFYLICPLILFLLWKKRIKPIVASLIICISLLINLLGAPQYNIATFYLPPSRFWELGLGGAIAYVRFFHSNHLQKTTTAPYINLLNLLGILSFSALLLSIFYFNSSLIYPGWAVLLPTLCTGVLLCTTTSWVNRTLLATPFLTLIGIISYPLYLWHWELLSFARIILSETLSYRLASVLLLISLGLAWMTYQFIEKPIRFSIKGKRYASSIAQILGLFLVSVGVIAFMVYNQHGLESRSVAQTQKSFTNDITNFERYKTNMQQCNTTNQQVKNLEWCLQTREGTPNKVVWGDSHADHLFPGLLKYAPQENWLLLGQSSCPPVLGVQGFWVGLKDTCALTNKIALQIILENPSIDTVILASLGPFYVSDQGYAAQHLGKYAPSGFTLRSEKENHPLEAKAKVFYDGLALTITKLHQAGKKVILFQDVPEIPFMPARCLNRPLAPYKSCHILKSDVLKRQNIYKAVLTQLKKEHPDIRIFNPVDFMCKQNCPLTYKNHLIYRDSHHLSTAGSHFIGKKLINWMKQQPTIG